MRDSSLIRMVLQAGAGRANAFAQSGFCLRRRVCFRSGLPRALLGAAMAGNNALRGPGMRIRVIPNVYPVLRSGLHLLAAAFCWARWRPWAGARDGDY